MQKKITILIGLVCILGFCSPLLAQQDTVRSLIISEYQGTGEIFMEFTNVGQDPVDLSRFTWQVQNWNATWTFDGPNTSSPGGGPAWMGGPVRLGGNLVNSLPGMPDFLQPGKSIVLLRIQDAAIDDPESRFFKRTQNRPDFLSLDAYLAKVHLLEGSDTLFPYRPELEMWGKDSISHFDNGVRYERITTAGNGTTTGALYYVLDNGDSVLVDQIGVKEDPVRTGTTLDIPADIAGVYQAQASNHLVRKFTIKEGTWDWDLSRGIDFEDSQWLVLPPWDSWKVPTTVGSHGDYTFQLSSETVTINEADEIITVPWATYKGDSILDEFTFGPGMSWNYIEDSLSVADSAFMRVQDGDIFNVYAVGNTLEWKAYEVQVADPPADMALIFPKRRMLTPEQKAESGWDGRLWGGAPYWVTENDPVIDTIMDVPFAERVDTLYKYLEKAPDATWEIEFVDGQNRADLKYGDKLVVTAEDGSTQKEYFIKAVQEVEYPELLAGKNALLGAITWPDIPGFMEGWKGDTVPFFNPTKTAYVITLPMGTERIPALQAYPSDVNASVSEKRATLLRGSVNERTTTFTITAEDGLTTMEYMVIFNVDKPTTKKQLYRAEPIFTEYNMSPGVAFSTEFCNVGDVPLDLSGYLYAGGINISPGQAIEIGPPETFKNRFSNYYVPGFRPTDNEAVYDAEKGYLFYDPAVDPVLEPGDVFVFTSINMDGSRAFTPGTWRYDIFWDLVYPSTDVIPNYWDRNANTWELYGFNLNTWGLTNSTYSNNLAGLSGVKYLFKIQNDSLIESRKPVGDPLDFDLVDFLGDPNAAIWREIWLDGRPQQDSETRIRWYNARKRPQYFLPHDDLDTVHMQLEWKTLAFEDPEVVGGADALGVHVRYFPAMDIGSHTFDPVTVHKSTVSSVAYLVSDGYQSPQSIQGDLLATSLNQFMGNVIKSNPDQALSVLSGTDGSEKGPDDAVAENDTLVVVSADTENMTKYVLVNQPLDNNATLTVKSAYSHLYTISVDGDQGTITGEGIGWNKPLKDLLAGVSKPATASLAVIDQHGELVATKTLNFDTALVDVLMNDSIYIEVVAQNNVDKMLYRLAPPSQSSDAFVTSSVFLINQANQTINLVPNGIAVGGFMEHLVPATGATATLVDKYSGARTLGILASDDKVKVVSQDGTRTAFYYINFFGETMPDNNLAPTLALAYADTNIVVNSTIKLLATAEDDGMPQPSTLSVLWEVVSGDPAMVNIASPDQASSDATFTGAGAVQLRITVSDGELSESAIVNVGVTTPNNLAPSVDVTFADSTIAAGSNLMVSATATDDGNPSGSTLTYAWTVKTGAAANVTIASPTESSTDVSISAPGVYTLQITVSDGEAVDSEIIVIVVIDAIGVEPIAAPDLRMYPNPASRMLTLEMVNTGGDQATVRIVNIAGRTVYLAEQTGEKIEIDVSQMDAGIYFVAVKAGDYSTTRKLHILK